MGEEAGETQAADPAGEDVPSESDGDTLDPVTPEKQKGLFGDMDFDLGGMGRFIAIGGAAVAFFGAGGLLIWRKKKKEREAAARRRERRRQRLSDIGYSEEAFEKLMEERRGRDRRR